MAKFKQTSKIFIKWLQCLLVLLFSHNLAIAENAVKSLDSTGGYWLESEQIGPGMKIVTSDGRALTVSEPWHPRERKETTYNFTVANSHTYFVTQQALWVHNTCLDPDDILHYSTLMKNKKLNYQLKAVEDRLEIELTESITKEQIRNLSEIFESAKKEGINLVIKVAKDSDVEKKLVNLSLDVNHSVTVFGEVKKGTPRYYKIYHPPVEGTLADDAVSAWDMDYWD